MSSFHSNLFPNNERLCRLNSRERNGFTFKFGKSIEYNIQCCENVFLDAQRFLTNNFRHTVTGEKPKNIYNLGDMTMRFNATNNVNAI